MIINGEFIQVLGCSNPNVFSDYIVKNGSEQESEIFEFVKKSPKIFEEYCDKHKMFLRKSEIISAGVEKIEVYYREEIDGKPRKEYEFKNRAEIYVPFVFINTNEEYYLPVASLDKQEVEDFLIRFLNKNNYQINEEMLKKQIKDIFDQKLLILK